MFIKSAEEREKRDHQKGEAIKQILPSVVGIAAAPAASSIITNTLYNRLRSPDDVKSKEVYDKIKAHGKHAIFTKKELKDLAETVRLGNTINAEAGARALENFSNRDGAAVLHRARQSPEALNFLDSVNLFDGKDSAIFSGTHSETLHELGHATGKGKKILDRFKDMDIHRRGFDLSKKVFPATQAAMLLGTTTASDEKRLDLMDKANKAHLIGQSIANLPLLMEEARASIRGYGFGKKFGVPANKAELAGAFSTYLAPALARTAIPYYLNKKIIDIKREQLRNQKK